jgi:peptidoglycan/xylan/chitin deacetylase (PgdA/CDA1 family)
MPRARSRSALSRLCGLAVAAAPVRATVHPGDAAATTCPRPKVMRRRELVYGQDPVNKLVALTFDDGPDPTWTPRVLDVLRPYHVKATFFVLGVNAERYPSLVARIRREGHTVANHTWSHRAVTTLGPAALRNDLLRTSASIKRHSGQKVVCWFRPPYLLRGFKQRGIRLVGVNGR